MMPFLAVLFMAVNLMFVGASWACLENMIRNRTEDNIIYNFITFVQRFILSKLSLPPTSLNVLTVTWCLMGSELAILSLVMPLIFEGA